MVTEEKIEAMVKVLRAIGADEKTLELQREFFQEAEELAGQK